MKRREKKRSNLGFALFCFAVVVVDWFFQYKTKVLNYGVENTGISFGLGENLENFWKILLPAVLVTWLVFELKSSGLKLSRAVIFLFVGGVGNIVPRLFYGFVWDYIKLPIVNLWVNLSDVLITFAVVSYILSANEFTDSLRG